MTVAGLRAVFLAERPRLLRLLRARLQSTEDAEEALQDLWIRIDALDARPIAEPTAYLMKMANNLASDRRIAGVRRGTLETHWHDVQPQSDERPDPERSLIARDWLAHVRRAIDAMPERMREAYTLFRIDGLSQRAIAERMGVSLSAVEKLLHRAYARLHQLEEQADGDD